MRQQLELLLASDWLRVCRRNSVTAEVTPWFSTFVKHVSVAACCKLKAHYTTLTLSCDWLLTNVETRRPTGSSSTTSCSTWVDWSFWSGDPASCQSAATSVSSSSCRPHHRSAALLQRDTRGQQRSVGLSESHNIMFTVRIACSSLNRIKRIK